MTIYLSQTQHDMARMFIFSQGRKLDQKLYDYYFNQGSVEAVVEALGEYRNQDGGFGKGLEPDVRMPGSSVIATTIAFQIMQRLKLSESHPFVCEGVLYFLRSYQSESIVWFNVPEEVDQYPHAPWWGYKPDPLNHLANPRVEILGYLFDYQGLVPLGLLRTLQAEVLNFMDQSGNKMEMHDLLCYSRLVQSKGISTDFRETIIKKLTPIVDNVVETDPEKWTAYVLRPLQLVDSPVSVFADHFAASVQNQLAFEISDQGEDGAWRPTWTWGDFYSENWPEVEQEWKSRLTLNKLLQFKEFGCLFDLD
jgi:hypothetical protein